MAGVEDNKQVIKVYDKESNAYHTVTISCNIGSGKGVVGAYGYSQYDSNWSGTYTISPRYYETTDTMAIEVHNVSGYEIVGVEGQYNVTNLSGPHSMSGGKYWTFKLTNDCQLKVTYRQTITKYTVTTSVSPSGAGTTTGGGSYNPGTVVNLIAYHGTDYIFDHWNIDGRVVYDPTTTITVNSNINATAYFLYNKATVTITVEPTGGGTTTGQGTYNKGTVVNLLAYPSEGYLFEYWLIGGTRYTDPSKTIQVNESISVIAHFKEHLVTIELQDDPSNVGILQQQQRGGSIWYGREHQWRPNTEITIGALENNDSLYKFSHWFSGEDPSHYNRFQNYTTDIIGNIFRATYKLKNKITLNIVFAGTYEHSDLYYNILTATSGVLTKLNAVTWLTYESIRLDFDIQVRNPDYQIEKVEFDDWEHGWTTISTQGIFQWFTPEITDDKDHYGTIRITVRPNTVKRRNISLAIFPRDTLATVELTHYYYDWNRQLWLFNIYTITATDTFSLTVADGDKISLNAKGYMEGTTIWAFDYWNGDLPEPGYKTVNQINNIVVGKDMKFYANFTYGLTFQTYVEPSDAGYIAIVPPAEQIDDHNWVIGLGQRLRMRAIGYTGYTFSHWTLDGTMGPDTDEYTIASMTSQDYHIFRAYFNGGVGPVDEFYLHVHANPIEGGIVTIDGEEVESVTKPRNTVVTIKAIPNLGYRFIGWVTGEKDDELDITMDQDKSL